MALGLHRSDQIRQRLCQREKSRSEHGFCGAIWDLLKLAC